MNNWRVFQRPESSDFDRNNNMNRNHQPPVCNSLQPIQGCGRADFVPATIIHQQSFFNSDFSHNSSSSSLKTDGSQFPDYQLAVGQNFDNQHTTELTNADVNMFPLIFDEDFSPNENQIFNPMEDDFTDMDDGRNQEVDGAGIWSRKPGTEISQPINIQNQSLIPTEVYNHNAPSNAYYHAQETTVLSAPARDYRENNGQNGNFCMFGSALSSPGVVSHTKFENQLECNHSLQSYNIPNNQAGFEMSPNLNVVGSAQSDDVFAERKELVSSFQYAQSPGYCSSSADQSAFFTSSISGDENINDGFSSSSNTNLRFQNFASSADYNDAMLNLVPETKPNVCDVNYLLESPQQYPHQAQQRLRCESGGSSFSSTSYSPGTYQQDEAGTSGMDRDYNRSLTEHTKSDQRRIRNNRACRKSRRKRKIEKEQTEAKVSQLADENCKLKEQIRNLESFVEAVRGDVKRKMSHS